MQKKMSEQIKDNFWTLFVLFSIFLIIFSGITIFLRGGFSTRSLSDIEDRHIKDFDAILNIQISGMDESVYGVLIYGDDQPSRDVSSAVLRFLSQQERFITLLLYDASEQVGENSDFEGGFGVATEEDTIVTPEGIRIFDPQINNGVTESSKIRLFGLPTLIIVSGGEIIYTFSSVEQIEFFLLNSD